MRKILLLIGILVGLGILPASPAFAVGQPEDWYFGAEYTGSKR